MADDDDQEEFLDVEEADGTPGSLSEVVEITERPSTGSPSLASRTVQPSVKSVVEDPQVSATIKTGSQISRSIKLGSQISGSIKSGSPKSGSVRGSVTDPGQQNGRKSHEAFEESSKSDEVISKSQEVPLTEKQSSLVDLGDKKDPGQRTKLSKWQRQCNRQFRDMIGKRELKNEELERQKGDLHQRLNILECSMPAVMVWNIWRMAQGSNAPCLQQVLEKQFQGPASGEVYCPSTPSRHFDCRVREAEAERKEAARRVEEARTLWAEKMASLEDREDRLQEAKRTQEEQQQRIEQLSSEVEKLRESKPVDDGACEAGECGVIECKKRWLDKVPSSASIRSTDIECLEKLQELAQAELSMKRQIADLERREEAYMRTLQQADELWCKTEEDAVIALEGKALESQRMAGRIGELEDEVEKLRDRLKTCRGELEKYMSIGKIEALIGRDDDFADVRDSETTAIVDVKDGATERDDDYADTDTEDPSLRDASSRDASLKDASIRDASLKDASLRDASLKDASIRDASLTDASLRDIPTKDIPLEDALASGAPIRPGDLGKATMVEIRGYLNQIASLSELDGPGKLCGPDFDCNDVGLTETGLLEEERIALDEKRVTARELLEMYGLLEIAEQMTPDGEAGVKVTTRRVEEYFEEVTVKETVTLVEDAEETVQKEIVYDEVAAEKETVFDEEVPLESESEIFYDDALEDDVTEYALMPEKDQEPGLAPTKTDEDVLVPLEQLCSWQEHVHSIRTKIADCSSCVTVDGAVEIVAEELAAYTGRTMKLEVADRKPGDKVPAELEDGREALVVEEVEMKYEEVEEKMIREPEPDVAPVEIEEREFKPESEAPVVEARAAEDYPREAAPVAMYRTVVHEKVEAEVARVEERVPEPREEPRPAEEAKIERAEPVIEPEEIDRPPKEEVKKDDAEKPPQEGVKKDEAERPPQEEVRKEEAEKRSPTEEAERPPEVAKEEAMPPKEVPEEPKPTVERERVPDEKPEEQRHPPETKEPEEVPEIVKAEEKVAEKEPEEKEPEPVATEEEAKPEEKPPEKVPEIREDEDEETDFDELVSEDEPVEEVHVELLEEFEEAIQVDIIPVEKEPEKEEDTLEPEPEEVEPEDIVVVSIAEELEPKEIVMVPIAEELEPKEIELDVVPVEVIPEEMEIEPEEMEVAPEEIEMEELPPEELLEVEPDEMIPEEKEIKVDVIPEEEPPEEEEIIEIPVEEAEEEIEAEVPETERIELEVEVLEDAKVAVEVEIEIAPIEVPEEPEEIEISIEEECICSEVIAMEYPVIEYLFPPLPVTEEESVCQCLAEDETPVEEEDPGECTCSTGGGPIKEEEPEECQCNSGATPAEKEDSGVSKCSSEDPSKTSKKSSVQKEDSGVCRCRSKTPSGGSKTPSGSSKTQSSGSKTPSVGSKTPSAGSKTPSAGSKTPSKASKRSPPSVQKEDSGICRCRSKTPSKDSKRSPPSTKEKEGVCKCILERGQPRMEVTQTEIMQTEVTQTEIVTQIEVNTLTIQAVTQTVADVGMQTQSPSLLRQPQSKLVSRDIERETVERQTRRQRSQQEPSVVMVTATSQTEKSSFLRILQTLKTTGVHTRAEPEKELRSINYGKRSEDTEALCNCCLCGKDTVQDQKPVEAPTSSVMRLLQALPLLSKAATGVDQGVQHESFCQQCKIKGLRRSSDGSTAREPKLIQTTRDQEVATSRATLKRLSSRQRRSDDSVTAKIRVEKSPKRKSAEEKRLQGVAEEKPEEVPEGTPERERENGCKTVDAEHCVCNTFGVAGMKKMRCACGDPD